MTVQYDPEQGKRYRSEAKGLAELHLSVKERLDKAVVDGDLNAGREALEELKLRTQNFETLRQELGDAGVFLAKYGVEVRKPDIDVTTDPPTVRMGPAVSFVLPQGVSRIEILEEAQKLVTDRNLIWPNSLERWRNDPKFTTKAEQTERFYIDGHVPNSVNKNRQGQEQYVKDEGKRLSLNVELPNVEDLAVAFVMHYVATKGEPLFGWNGQSRSFSHTVRAAGGALDFASDGLYVNVIGGAVSDSVIAVSARALPESKMESDSN